MIYVEDNSIRIGGVTLPGLYKGMEIVTEAVVEEQEVKGSSKKPKQATGYEDAKITIDIELYPSPGRSIEDKLQEIQMFFRKPGQSKPAVHTLVSEHTTARGINQVIFKQLSTKTTNKADKITVGIELWEFAPVVLKAVKKGKSKSKNKKSTASTSGTASSSLSANYQTYVKNDRGSVPKIDTKLDASPAANGLAGIPSSVTNRVSVWTGVQR